VDRTRRLKQYDAATGEILNDGFVAYIAPKRKNGFQEGWLAMGQGMVAVNLAKSANLQGQDFRVFLVLLANLEHENFILTPQARMAESIGMKPTHFSRSVSRLVEEGVIEKGPKIGRMNSYKLNPEYGWKGSAQNHQKALDERRKQRMKNSGITGVIEGGKE
jgi:predicted transcriptional regulator